MGSCQSYNEKADKLKSESQSTTMVTYVLVTIAALSAMLAVFLGYRRVKSASALQNAVQTIASAQAASAIRP